MKIINIYRYVYHLYLITGAYKYLPVCSDKNYFQNACLLFYNEYISYKEQQYITNQKIIINIACY